MGTLEVVSFFFFFFFLIFPDISATESDCSSSSCRYNDSIIRFPFRLDGRQPKNCGYPGFDLSCNNESTTVLNLPSSGEFLVRDISYDTQEIRIYDPYNCLPRRFLQLNFSGSPFNGVYNQNYTFLSCPVDLTRERFTPIVCLSNITHNVLATSSMNFARLMSNICNLITTVSVPLSWPAQSDQYGFSSDLSDDLLLQWDVPNCRDCEAQGGQCRFDSNASLKIGCSYNLQPANITQLPIYCELTSEHISILDRPRHLRSGLQILKIISLATGIPAITCSIGIVCYICFVDRDARRRRTHNLQPTPALAEVSLQPTDVVIGLDEPTIDSYSKVILGESRRLPGPNGITCPICLSEYCPNETLRCIPECKHCFHADCIDEWLRKNVTCPVCRNSPLPAQNM
ncbi:hypothetical protein HHK36_029137 [Tetracentron sinense]|uniref:RING-type E3 ubiquitin transferase n=1 Tax=Tetracentron sinense TaxID=13715 RepID=A0A835D460_TETSI|nr:hypothetical protein HHK36_029137 [Tetracentron sinense]